MSKAIKGSSPNHPIPDSRKMALLLEMQGRTRSRANLMDYCPRVFPEYEIVPHIEILCKYLEAVATRRIKRLLISMPPRHSKTQTASILFPSWYLGRFPQQQFIGASYAEPLALNNSQACRDTITSGKYQVLWPHKLDVKGSVRWRIAGKSNKRPNFVAAGVGGAITGEGADILLIDDPFKNYEEAYSIVLRDKVWNWYTSTARTRIQPNGAIIIIATRWHHDDLIGRLIRQSANDPNADQWVELRLPAENADGCQVYPPEILPAYDALWPEHYPAEELSKLKAGLGSLLYNALYQQQPSDIEGQIIKRSWYKYYREDPALLGLTDWMQSWDMNFKDTTDSSYVVGQVWARKGSDRYLVHQYRERIGFTETLKQVKLMSQKYPRAHTKLVEDKANGSAVIDTLQKSIGGFIAIEPIGSKEARLQAASIWFESGNVLVPDPELHPWVRDLIEEQVTFPASPFSDQCDATSQALIRYMGGSSSLLRWLEGKYEQKIAPADGTSVTDDTLVAV